MLDYLKKFEQLPASLRQKVSTQAVVTLVDQLEKKYNLPLAALVMKVMIKEVRLNDLASYLLSQGLISGQVEGLDRELKEKVFKQVQDYLLAAVKEVKAEITPAKTPTEMVRGANFFFSPEDEQEIRELTKKYDGYSESQAVSNQIEERIDRVISQAQINFGSEELVGRFRQILRTYLKGIRDRIEVKQTLVKPFTSGGLSFDLESAENVLRIADNNLKQYNKQEKIKPIAKIRLPEIDRTTKADLKSSGVRDVEYDLASSLAKTKPKIDETKYNKFDRLDTGHELAPPPPVLTKKLETPVKSAPVIKKDNLTSLKPNLRRQIDSPSKVKVEDVKYVPKIMGPIDELKYMDLISFRRLSQDPRQSVNKIKEIVDLLEEESFGKRLEAIKAWRNNPTNKLYILLGQQSIRENKPIEEIISERKAGGEEYLTSEEFTAIMDLNKSLRF